MLVPALLSCAVSKTDLLDDTATAPSTTVTDTTTIPTTTTTTTIQTTTTTQTTNVTELPIYTLEVLLTVDDAWDLYVDGVFIDAQSGWSFADTSTSVVNLNTDGPHVVAVHGYDQQQIISGFMAEVRLNGVVIGLTDGSTWKVTDVTPPPDWIEPRFDDSTWGYPGLCDPADVSYRWGDRPTALTSLGAEWVWSRPCQDLGHSWFRLNFEILP